MPKISDMTEVFIRLMSEGLGINFTPRDSISHFLVSIEAFPEKVVTDNELIPCLEQCLSAMGLEIDLNSLMIKGDFTWIKVKNGSEAFSVGITALKVPYFQIIITLAPF